MWFGFEVVWVRDEFGGGSGWGVCALGWVAGFVGFPAWADCVGLV